MFLSVLGWELNIVGPKTEQQERNNSEGIIAPHASSSQTTSLPGGPCGQLPVVPLIGNRTLPLHMQRTDDLLSLLSPTYLSYLPSPTGRGKLCPSAKQRGLRIVGAPSFT